MNLFSHTTECFEVEQKQYFFNSSPQGKSFVNAGLTCEGQNLTLATVSNRPEFDFIRDFVINTEELNEKRYWLSLRHKNRELESDSQSTNFTFTSGNDDTSFFQNPNEIPWLPSQPNNLNNNQNCVTWDFSKTTEDIDGWDDNICTLPRFFICEGQGACVLPTISPTSSPTVSPTSSPTYSPTVSQTTSPSLSSTTVDEELSLDSLLLILGLSFQVVGVILLVFVVTLALKLHKLKKKVKILQVETNYKEVNSVQVEIPEI